VRVLDPGHQYALQHLEADGEEVLTFIKRNGGPVIRDEEYPGTTTQEAIRACIDRTKYVDALLPCRENELALAGLRQALYWYEARAYRRHVQHINRLNVMDDESLALPLPFVAHEIELLPTCPHCGHIVGDWDKCEEESK
jgi:hypothetical protein